MNYYKPLTYMVGQDEDGWILKSVLQKRLGLSRKLLSRLKLTEKGIMVNGQRQYISIRVAMGDLIEVYMEEEVSEDILPEPLPLDILYEDEHLLVVNKAPGIIVHPTHGHYTGTLANGVVYYWQQKGERYRFRPIHRLDQETSGVLAIAKNPYAHQHISEQMIAKTVDKRYAAIVHGILEFDRGILTGPIDRDPEQPHVRIVMPEGQGYDALTHYHVCNRMKESTWVSLKLETGRTHQIRVHMRHLGHPLIGDKLYGDPEADERIGCCITRHALHAEELAFRHPATGEALRFVAPWPDDMSELQHQLTEEWIR